MIKEKYNHHYSDSELRTWLSGIEQLASQTSEVYALLNNCVEDKGIRNGQDLARLLREVPDGATVPGPAGSSGDGLPGRSPLQARLL